MCKTYLSTRKLILKNTLTKNRKPGHYTYHLGNQYSDTQWRTHCHIQKMRVLVPGGIKIAERNFFFSTYPAWNPSKNSEEYDYSACWKPKNSTCPKQHPQNKTQKAHRFTSKIPPGSNLQTKQQRKTYKRQLDSRIIPKRKSSFMRDMLNVPRS